MGMAISILSFSVRLMALAPVIPAEITLLWV